MANDSHLEIQIHPSDIRRKVRYIFLSRRQLAWIVGGVLTYLTFLVVCALVAPRVIRDLLQSNRYHALESERQQLRGPLQERIREFQELADRSGELHLTMQRIRLAYGIRSDESIGQGGFPHIPDPAPESVYKGVIQNGSLLEAQVGEQLDVLEAFIEEVHGFEQIHRDQVTFTPSTNPLGRAEFVLTSPFGYRENPFTKARDFHNGVDLAAAVGTPIHASADGVVKFAGRYRLRGSVHWWRYGNLVVIHHQDQFITLYAHCDEVKVSKGQRVKQGDVIATVGSTGWSTNPHLHYEIRRISDGGRDTAPVDPLIYMLDYDLGDQEQLLVAARVAPEAKDFEPLPQQLVQ